MMDILISRWYSMTGPLESSVQRYRKLGLGLKPGDHQNVGVCVDDVRIAWDASKGELP